MRIGVDSCLKIIFKLALGGSISLAIRARCVTFGVETCNVDTYTVCKKCCSSVKKNYNLTMMGVSEVMSDKFEVQRTYNNVFFIKTKHLLDWKTVSWKFNSVR